MKSKLKKFTLFCESLFPTELAYILTNNEFQDPEYQDILNKIQEGIGSSTKRLEFDENIDARKYSRLMQSIKHKLKAIDVDAYYGWISSINHQINTDAIPPDEQAKIIQEIEAYQAEWFHSSSFYRAIATYEAYLLFRYREKDFRIIRTFLAKHEDSYRRNEEIAKEVQVITELIVTQFHTQVNHINSEDVQKLFTYFTDKKLSKKTRYNAWLAYLMYHINTRQYEALSHPMHLLENQILDGQFYSRRILANFYANKLLVLSHSGKYKEAAYYGSHSLKQQTEDYLYYLNNYCSVLLHLGRNVEAAELMKSQMPLYRTSIEKNRKLIFASNYCRCLNGLNQYTQSMRMAAKELRELDEQVFKLHWHYFFRTYFAALQGAAQYELIIRMERKYKLQEREMNTGKAPFLQAYIAMAQYQEMKITEKWYRECIDTIGSKANTENHSELMALSKKMESLLG